MVRTRTVRYQASSYAIKNCNSEQQFVHITVSCCRKLELRTLFRAYNSNIL